MPKANPIRTIIFILIVSGFILGVIHLFFLRFEAGDVYPPYSSLRSDPLGSRALYRSLGNLRHGSVDRNYLSLRELKFGENSAFLYIGVSVFDAESVSREWLKIFERLTNSGGRLVLSFLPVEKKPANWRMSSCFQPGRNIKENKKSGQENSPKDPDAHSNEENETPTPKPENLNESDNCISLQETWGLNFGFAESLPDKAVRSDDHAFKPPFKGLPQTISWHTALYFDDLENSWQVIYTADGRPGIIERPFGNGSLVLAADSFFMSNEALRSERYPELLAWTIGQHSRIIFDETHFGILRHPGVLTLIKKYRFHWFIAALAILAFLFIWKNSVYFVPPSDKNSSGSGQGVISDRDSTQGLISLLRRNIPSGQILQTCAREWKRTFQPEKRFQDDKLENVKSALQTLNTQSSKSMDPVIAYRRISKILSKDRHYE